MLAEFWQNTGSIFDQIELNIHFVRPIADWRLAKYQSLKMVATIGIGCFSEVLSTSLLFEDISCLNWWYTLLTENHCHKICCHLSFGFYWIMLSGSVFPHIFSIPLIFFLLHVKWHICVCDFHTICHLLSWASGGEGEGSKYKQPTPCPLHGHRTEALACIMGCKTSTQSTYQIMISGVGSWCCPFFCNATFNKVGSRHVECWGFLLPRC